MGNDKSSRKPAAQAKVAKKSSFPPFFFFPFLYRYPTILVVGATKMKSQESTEQETVVPNFFNLNLSNGLDYSPEESWIKNRINTKAISSRPWKRVETPKLWGVVSL
jgi:hypothetical protein